MCVILRKVKKLQGQPDIGTVEIIGRSEEIMVLPTEKEKLTVPMTREGYYSKWIEFWRPRHTEN